jgi:pimeloyl-ACP methyl ester carboxylesterase
MPTAMTNTKHIAYQCFGDPDNPALLLIQGLSMPSTAWPKEWIDQLVVAGYFVVSFDNRDIGQSRIYDELKKPNIALSILKKKLGFNVKSAYSLSDMAEDAIALLNELNIDRAHIMGVSMGGMIGQHIAAEHPNKVLSFIQIMSTSGAKSLPGPSKAVLGHMAKGPAAKTRQSIIDYNMEMQRLVGTKEHPLEGDRLRQFVENNFDRGQTSAGILRQTHAIISDGDRSKLIETITCPTLIIHGDRDPLVHVDGAYDCARKINGAQLEIIEDMGHDLPPSLIGRLTQLCIAHLKNLKDPS